MWTSSPMILKFFPFLLVLILFLPVTPAPAGQANVFVYHRFGDDRYPSTNISLETFAAQLQLLRERNYVVLSLGEVVRRLGEGLELPEHCAVITVDDAYASFLSGAMPLLRQYGFPATLFINTGTVGSRGYLNWDQLRSLAGEGMEMGNHTVSHPYLLNRMKGENEERWRKRVRKEIVRAQEKLEKELGDAPRLFAYPFGEYSPKIVEIVRGLGFVGATGQQSGVIFSGSDRFALPRFPMGGPYATYRGFLEKLTMRALPVEVVFPASPVVADEDPPTLVVQIEGEGIDLSRLRCFVQQQPEGKIIPDPEIVGRFAIRAKKPLSGRRNKYTLTAPGAGEGEWFWFSQLWIYPSRGVSGTGFQGNE